MSYRKADIIINDQKAGELEEIDTGYRFLYDAEYLQQKKAQAVSLTLPLQDEPHESSTLFSFFEGLIPEGWLLEIIIDTWNVDRDDKMGLLLVSCQDTIGNVSVRPR